MSDSVPSISVVVPVYNQTGILHASVPAVLGLRGVEEIVFVDDGSTDESPSVVEALINRATNARLVVHPHNQGRAAARNSGVAASKSDVVLFLDADIIPEPDAAHIAAGRFANGSVVGVLLADRPDELNSDDPFHRYLIEVSGPSMATPDQPLHFKHLISGHSAIRRSALDRVGGFDPEISYGEDLELAHRLEQAFPGSLRLEPRAIVHQRGIGDLDERITRLHEFGSNLHTLRTKHPELLAAADLGFVDSAFHRPLASRMVSRLCRSVLTRSPWGVQRALIRLILASAILRGYREGS